MAKTVEVYIENGAKRVFAGALEWPGWCRSGKDEASALLALLQYALRYKRVVRGERIEFAAPGSVTALKVVERLKGGSGTDFGAPEAAPASDARPMSSADEERATAMLRACWQEFDRAAAAARGKRLRTGPRGGGRDLARMSDHVREAEIAYIGRLGWWAHAGVKPPPGREHGPVREAALQALHAAVQGVIPSRGPRGGKRWSPRYFVRRAAWHALDHAWELEDRIA